MSLFAAVPGLLLLTAVLWLPGLALARAAGLRGPVLWLLAPHLTLTVLTTLCVLAPVVGQRWGWGALAVSTGILVSLAWCLRSVLLRRGRGWTVRRTGDAAAEPRRVAPALRRPDLTVLAATGLGTGLVLAASVPAMGRPDAVSQSPDMSFHVNTIRWMLDHGDFSALDALDATPATTGGFYPTAFHDWVASALTLVHLPVLTAANLASLVIASLLWPAGCVLLVRQALGGTRLQLLLTGVLSASFVAFPYYLMGWGVLWPNELGLALVPGVLALLLSLLGLGERQLLPRLPAALLFLATLPGLALAHPNALVTAGGFGLCMGAVWLARACRRASGPARWWLLGAGAVTLAALGGVTVLLPRVSTTFRLTFHYPSRPWESPLAAATDMVLNDPRGYAALWGLSALVLIGMGHVVLRARRHLWAVLGFVLFSTLYVFAAGVGTHWSRLFTGYWYHDAVRLSAAVPVAGVVLGVVGFEVLVGWATRLSLRVARHRGGLLPGAAPARRWAVAGVAVLVAATTLGVNHQAAHDAVARYYHPDRALRRTLLATNQVDELRRLARDLPRNAVVAANPFSGSTLLWAAADRKVLFPTLTPLIYQGPLSQSQRDLLLIGSGLRRAASEPGVCQALRRQGVTYAMGGAVTYDVQRWRHLQYAGTDGLAFAPGFVDVASAGRFTLYRITACGGGHRPRRA